MNLSGKSILANTLDANNVKIRFKGTPFSGFVKNGDVVDMVRGTELDLSLSDLFKIVYAGVQKNYTAFKSIQTALNAYISKMKAVAAEVETRTDSTRVILISLPSVLERLHENKGNLGYELSSTFTNTEVVGDLLKRDFEDSELVKLMDGLTFDGECDALESLRNICNTYFQHIPNSNPNYLQGVDEMFQVKTESGLVRIALFLHLLNKLIDNPSDAIMADGINGSRYHNDIVPVLQNFRAYFAHRAVIYIDAIKNLISRKILVFGFSDHDSVTDMYVFKEVYDEYIQATSEIDGASDAVYGIMFKREFADANIERVKQSISLLAGEFNVRMELEKKTGRRTANIQLADYFTDFYIEMIEDYVGGNEKLAVQIEEKFMDDINILPSREEVVKFAYDKLTKVIDVNDTEITMICFDIVELALNKLQPYLGTYVRALSKESFENKVLSNGSLVLASLMEVTADMLFDQLEIIKG